MNVRTLCLLAALATTASFANIRADAASNAARLRWVVASQHSVDKASAEAAYAQACDWLQDQLEEPDAAVCPVITVHVGELCPNQDVGGSCMNPKLGQLYLERWDEESLDSVAEVTVATGLVQYMEPSGKARAA